MKGLAIVLLGVAVALQVGRDRFYPRDTGSITAPMYVRSAGAIDRLALSFDSLAADVYWIRAIQYYGRQRLSRAPGERDYSQLYPLLDLTTSLDPYFNIAYRFGAIFLSERQPGGPGRPDLAQGLLMKGIASQPDAWQFYHDIGFVHYWTLGDTATAADWFRRAAERPGAPTWLAPIAAAMLTQGTDRASARQLWQQLAAGAQEDWLKRRAELALAQLQAMDWIDQLEAAARQLPGPPYTWNALARARRLTELPRDPSGTPFEIDPVSGRVTVSRQSPLFPMPPSPPK